MSGAEVIRKHVGAWFELKRLLIFEWCRRWV